MTFRPMPATARLLALTAMLLMVVASGPARAQITEQALLDSLQRTAFQFFWDEANPANGLIRDRHQPWSPASIASTGFGLSAITVGVDHGWVSRTDAANRVLTTLTTFWNGPQGTGLIGYMGYKGWFYHFLPTQSKRLNGLTFFVALSRTAWQDEIRSSTLSNVRTCVW